MTLTVIHTAEEFNHDIGEDWELEDWLAFGSTVIMRIGGFGVEQAMEAIAGIRISGGVLTSGQRGAKLAEALGMLLMLPAGVHADVARRRATTRAESATRPLPTAADFPVAGFPEAMTLTPAECQALEQVGLIVRLELGPEGVEHYRVDQLHEFVAGLFAKRAAMLEDDMIREIGWALWRFERPELKGPVFHLGVELGFLRATPRRSPDGVYYVSTDRLGL